MKLSDGLFGLVAVAGAVVFIAFYDSAFPAAAIDLQLSRGEIRELADAYVRGLGVDPDTFESTLTFQVDAGPATFLQRVVGLEETTRMAREELALWNWRVRWFRSGEKEEFVLRLTPSGRPLRFRHAIPEAAAGDSIGQDSARVIAAAFVTNRLGIELESWRLDDQSTRARDKRVDHSFTWELIGSEIEWRPDDPEAGTASRRLTVGVQGSEVGEFSQFLKVPETFQREQTSEESLGGLLALVSIGLLVVLVIAALVVAIVLYKKDQVRWRPGFYAGAVVTAVVLLSSLLSFPLFKDLYNTNIPFAIFVAVAVIGSVLGGVIFGLAIWVCTAAGESLASESFGGGLGALSDWFAGRWFTRRAAAETLRGYAVGLGFLGYITLFYILGTRYLGVWLPADSPHSDLLSMYLPWLVPLLISIQAALSEEILFRFFGISFLKRYVKYTFIALLIPAMVWAFGHSTYPIYPVYVRGIELTIAGFIFGWIFLRYGLVTMLVAHYAIDAILLAMPLLLAAGGTYRVYGLVAMAFAALPLAVPVIAAFRPVPEGSASPGQSF